MDKVKKFKIFNWLKSIFKNDAPIKGKPVILKPSQVFYDIKDSHIYEVKNSEENYIYFFKDKTGTPQVNDNLKKIYIRSLNNSFPQDIDSSFYNSIRSKTFKLKYPENINNLIQIYNINTGSIFKLNNYEGIFELIEHNIIIFSEWNIDIRGGIIDSLFKSRFGIYYTVLFIFKNHNTGSIKYVNIGDIVLDNPDQERYKFKNKIEEYLEDYFIQFIDDNTINITVSILDKLNAEIIVIFTKKDINSMLEFLENLNTIKKRIENIEKLTFDISEISRSRIVIKLTNF